MRTRLLGGAAAVLALALTVIPARARAQAYTFSGCTVGNLACATGTLTAGVDLFGPPSNVWFVEATITAGTAPLAMVGLQFPAVGFWFPGPTTPGQTFSILPGSDWPRDAWPDPTPVVLVADPVNGLLRTGSLAVSAVPEPATLALTAGGLVGVAAVGRRRRAVVG